MKLGKISKEEQMRLFQELEGMRSGEHTGGRKKSTIDK